MSELNSYLRSLPPSTVDALLERFLRKAGGGIPRQSRLDNHYPLSFAEQRHWFQEQLSPGSMHLLPHALRLKGPLSVEHLERALDGLHRRHEGLRSIYKVVGGRPVKILKPYMPERLTIVDLSNASNRESCIRDLLDDEARRPMDLTTGPLWRALLIREAERSHILAITLHHIVSDGWTTGIALRELAAFYNLLCAGESLDKEEPKIQYIDFAAWETQRLSPESLRPSLDYWRNKLADAPDRLDLPCDRPRPPVRSHCGDTVARELSAELATKLKAVCEREGATPFMLFGAVLFAVLHRLTGQADICIGSPVAGRNHPDLAEVFGLFVNTVVLRCRVDASLSFAELLRQVRDVTHDAYEHQEVPFEKLVDELGIQRSPERLPLYQLLYVHQQTQVPALAELEVELLEINAGGAQFDLSALIAAIDDRMFLRLEYASDIFDRDTVETYADWLLDLTDLATAAPERPLSAALARIPVQTPRIALVSTFTAKPLAEHLEYWLARWAMPARIDLAPYAQVFQQLADPGSMARTNDEGVNLFLLRCEDWIQGARDTDPLSRLAANCSEFVDMLAATRGSALDIVFVCEPSAQFCETWGEAGRRIETDLAAALRRLATEDPRLVIATYSQLDHLYAVETRLDPKADAAGHIPYTQEYFAALGLFLTRLMRELGMDEPTCVFTDAPLGPDAHSARVAVQSLPAGCPEALVQALQAQFAGGGLEPRDTLFASTDAEVCQALEHAIPGLAVVRLAHPDQLAAQLIGTWALKAIL